MRSFAFDIAFFACSTSSAEQEKVKSDLSDFRKKYSIMDMVKGDVIFCATGITNGDIVSGIKIEENNYISETLITHKSTNLKKIIKSKNEIDE